MFKNVKKAVVTSVGVAFAASLPSVVFAQAVALDTTDAVAQIVIVGTALAAIGLALTNLAAIAVGWKWIKGMIFG